MNAPLIASDRVALLVSLVPYLRARDEPVPVADAAAHFGVDADTIRACVRLIAVSGSPGDGGAYQDLDLFDIDWDALENDDEIVVTRFVALETAPPMSGLETAALLAGLQYVRQLAGVTRTEAIDRLIAKLAPEGAPAPIAVEQGPMSDALPAVHEALEAGRRLAFDYRSPRSGWSQRVVDPIRLDARDDAWYLRAWCLDRDDERTFLVDRMEAARVLETPAEAHLEVELLDTLFTPAANDPVVTIALDASAVPLIREFMSPGDRVPKPDASGALRLDVAAGSWDAFVRLACGNPDRVRIVAPPEARAAVAQWAQRALGEHDAVDRLDG